MSCDTMRYDTISFYLFHALIRLIMMPNDSHAKTCALSAFLLYPSLLCFFPNGDLRVFYPAATDRVISLLPDSFPFTVPPPSSSSPVRVRSSPIISRRHHITQQLVAGNQSACLTPPDGPPLPPPSRPSHPLRLLHFASSPVAFPSSFTRQELPPSEVPGPSEGIYRLSWAIIGGGSTSCLPRGLNRVPRCSRRSEQPTFLRLMLT